MTDYRTTAQSWLSEEFDEQTRNEVKALMEGPQADLEDAFYRNLEFGTGGLRGIMGVGTNRMNSTLSEWPPRDLPTTFSRM